MWFTFKLIVILTVVTNYVGRIAHIPILVLIALNRKLIALT